MKLCAAIVETRNMEEMPSVLERHRPYLPPNTPFFLFTSRALVDKYSSTLKDVTVIGIQLRDESIHGYNLFLTDEGNEFWSYFLEFDRVLIFQTDSGLLRTGIERFYEYDYIGAALPTNHENYYPYCCNGGLSLRNPKIMLKIATEFSWKRDMGEDIFFARCMKNNNIGVLAPRDVAMEFSVETQFQLGTLGYHAPWKYLSIEQWNAIQHQYK